ncbi:YcnI family protein [Baekduia sp. Peel2402]|uniref:YcnI family protein n=1 Tax=Baekduia sp. Peel2402 TaxID=3458296 RepID=UPI00403E6211
MNKTLTTAAAALVLLGAPVAAQAHVTLQPNQAPAGAFTLEAVRVPNEQDDAVTTKVDVQLPHGFAAASYEAVPGWTAKIIKSKLAKPIETDDGPIDEEVSRITFTADSKKDAIQAGQFKDFPLSVQIPGKAGDKLTFKALQTYSNGDVVRWIGPADSDHPAPQITVTDAAAPAAGGTSTTAAASTPAATARDDSDSASKTLGIAGLVVGIVGVLLGGAALVTRRRPA